MASISCEDMLSPDMADKIEVNGNDTLYSYLGILNCLQNVAERQVILGELRGDLVTTTQYVTDTLAAIANFDDPQDGSCTMLSLRDYYNVINNCNFYLHNADTSLVKSNKKYMLPEYAQISIIRAWTYLQMVKNYGSVPFTADPIDDLSKAREIESSGVVVDKNNIVTLFTEGGVADITKYIDTDFPSLGSYSNGAVSIDARKLMIPARLVLGDMYLLRGQDETDYRKAAQYYFDYLKETESTVTTDYCEATANRGIGGGAGKGVGSEDDNYSYNTGGNWGQWAASYSYVNSYDEITQIPSSANRQFGTMLTRVADIFGFTPTSSQSSSTSENDDGDEETATSGAITVTPNHETQTIASGAFYTLAKSQDYVYYQKSGNYAIGSLYECGDVRYQKSVYDYTHDGESFSLCAKAAKGYSFYYTIPIYRKTIIWLRLAEAINRAGFPEYAFGILKDGLCQGTWPELVDKQSYTYDTVWNDVDPTMWDTILVDTTFYQEMKYNEDNALSYVDSVAFKNFFLDFSDEVWSGNYGIHARGCGYNNSMWADGSTELAYRTNLSGDHDILDGDTLYNYHKLIRNAGYDPEDKAQAIEAIENLIVDELALESAFEGNRFTDLVRVAERRGDKGAEWLALKIALRDRRYNKLKDDPSVREDQINAAKASALYQKLLNKSNWYFSLPK